MLNHIHPFKIVLPVLMALVLGSCSATRLTAVWHDDAYTVRALQKVLVKGVAQNQRDSLLFEDAFIKQFSQNGIEAFAGTRMTTDFKPDLPVEMLNGLIAEAQKRETDALLVVQLVGVVKKRIYHPPRPYFMSLGFMSSGYCDLHHLPHHVSSHFMSDPFYDSGYYTEHQFFQIESNLYASQTSQLIWSAASETFEPASMNALVESVSKVVIKNLRDSQLLHK